MSYIEKSEEIYKQVRKNKTPENPGGDPTLIPLRSMWVSGTHTEPVYKDHYITLTNFNSNTATVDDYTTKHETTTDDTCVHFLGIEKIQHIGIIDYHRRTLPNQTDDTCVHFLGIEKIQHLNITTYGRYYMPNQTDDTCVHFLGIEKIEHLTFGEKVQKNKNTNDGPTHSITVTGFDSNAVTVTS